MTMSLKSGFSTFGKNIQLLGVLPPNISKRPN